MNSYQWKAGILTKLSETLANSKKYMLWCLKTWQVIKWRNYKIIDKLLCLPKTLHIIAIYNSFHRTGKKCLFKPQDVGATLQSYKTIPAGKENDLQTAVATVGPVSVAIDASQPSFHFYKKGIYYEPGIVFIEFSFLILVSCFFGCVWHFRVNLELKT